MKILKIKGLKKILRKRIDDSSDYGQSFNNHSFDVLNSSSICDLQNNGQTVVCCF
jgi:hypothetical protein